MNVRFCKHTFLRCGLSPPIPSTQDRSSSSTCVLSRKAKEIGSQQSSEILTQRSMKVSLDVGDECLNEVGKKTTRALRSM